VIRELTDEMLLKNQIEEVQLSMNNQSDFNTWKQLISPTAARGPLPKERCYSDTAWQQKGSGQTHNSSSGNSLIFGHHICKPLVHTVKSKRCNCCSAHKKMNQLLTCHTMTSARITLDCLANWNRILAWN